MSNRRPSRPTYLLAIAFVLFVIGIVLSLPTILKPPRPLFCEIYATREMGWWPRWIPNPLCEDAGGNIAWVDRENNLILMATDIDFVDRKGTSTRVFHLAKFKEDTECVGPTGAVLTSVSMQSRNLLIRVYSNARPAQTIALPPKAATCFYQNFWSSNDGSVEKTLHDCGIQLEP